NDRPREDEWLARAEPGDALRFGVDAGLGREVAAGGVFFEGAAHDALDEPSGGRMDHMGHGLRMMGPRSAVCTRSTTCAARGSGEAAVEELGEEVAGHVKD